MAKNKSERVISRKEKVYALRILVGVILAVMCVYKLMFAYQGLTQPEAMDQAQIARSVANGEGFKTKVFRPMELMDRENVDPLNPVDLSTYNDVTHAPLNIVSMAVALRATGYHDFEKHRMRVDENGEMVDKVYGGDRVVSAMSCAWFVLAMLLAYILIARLFDDVVASATVCSLLFCELALDYAVSGLAQPMMMVFMLAGLNCLLSAAHAKTDKRTVAQNFYLGISMFMMSLMAISGWLSISVALGYFVFCAAYFRPVGLYGYVGLGILLVCAAPFMWLYHQAVGDVFGNAFYGIYNCFGASEEFILRSTNDADVPLENSWVVLRFIGAVFLQVRSVFVNMGGIIVGPFFFLSLFYSFKKDGVQCVKIAVMSMWIASCLAMAMYGTNIPLSAGQIAFLFTPLFVAYGFSILFNFIARLELKGITFNQMRSLIVLAVVVMAAGPLVSRLPRDTYRSVWIRDLTVSPFVAALHTQLHDKTEDYVTNAENGESLAAFVVTDQPAAVAWYANRRAIWLPLKVSDYKKLNDEVLKDAGGAIQGICITTDAIRPSTPPAYAPVQDMSVAVRGGIEAVSRCMGEFSGLIFGSADADFRSIYEEQGDNSQFNAKQPLKDGSTYFYRKERKSFDSADFNF